MNFLISRDGKQYGPYPAESLAEMMRKNEVTPTDLMFVEGWLGWRSVADYLKTQPPSSSAATPPPIPRQVPPPIPTATSQTPPIIKPGGAAAPLILESLSDLEKAVLEGGRFVIFQYCFSVLIMTFKRPSSIIFLRGDQDGFGQALTHSLISLTVGWWGIPWGPIWTIGTVIKNAWGGVDVTNQVLTEKLGAVRAAQIMAHRRPPSPRGNALKFFRWGLIGTPVLIFLLILLLPLTFSPARSVNSSRSASGEAAGFETANRQIAVYRDAVAFGNSAQAIAAATSFSKSMKTMRELVFEGGKKDGLSVSHHEFLTYCELHDSQCAFIVHVPELRRFTTDAKASLGNLAWMNALSALQLHGITNSELRLAVGLRGVALYDRVLLGNLPAAGASPSDGVTETVVGGSPEKRLLPFFKNATGKLPSQLDSQSATNASQQ